MNQRVLDARLDLVEPAHKSIGNPQCIEQRFHGLRVIVSPPVVLPPLAAKRHDHHHRHLMAQSEACDWFACLAQPGVLHDHYGALAAQVCAGHDPRHLTFVGDRDVADLLVLGEHLIHVLQQRFRQSRYDTDVGLMQASRNRRAYSGLSCESFISPFLPLY
jgi:hypothetical protein